MAQSAYTLTSSASESVHVDRSRNSRELGTYFRARRPGLEAGLIKSFLRKFPYAPRANCRLTVFHEPRMATGVPDIVAVIWDSRTVSAWRGSRPLLTPRQLRLLHLLVEHGPSTQELLNNVFGRGIVSDLEVLSVAGMVHKASEVWKPRALHKIFAVREIIAIEAKMDDWSTAILQASANTWFASLSCILVPHLPKGAPVLDRARLRGLGVWTHDNGTPVPSLKPKRRPLPRSYGSWLLNEWIYRLVV